MAITGDSRQQRRRHARERLKLGQSTLQKGLAVEPKRPEVVGVAEVLKAKLTESGNGMRAGEAAALAHDLAERSLRNAKPRLEVACAKGCNYCCHGFVGAVPPEAFRIARVIRNAASDALDPASVRARAKPLIGLSPAERVGRKLPCPLLVDGVCGVYRARPHVCRQTTSLSLPACREEFDGIDRNGRIEISSVHLACASNAHVALLGAMQAAGLPIVAYELAEMLDVVLSDPSSETRWLAGEPVFAAVKNVVVRPPNVDLVATRIAEALAP